MGEWMTDWREYLIDFDELSGLQNRDSRPLAFVNLDQCPSGITMPAMPPWPVVGIGDTGHPLAAYLDAMVEAPVTAQGLADTVCAHADAALVATGLLRNIEGMDPARALVAESQAYATLQGSADHAAWLGARDASPVLPEGRVQAERIDDALTISLDRPDAHNSIDRAMRDNLFALFNMAALDTDIRTVHLTGRGRTFSNGADLTEFGTTRDPATAHRIRMETLPAIPIIRMRERLHVHVTGACIGAGLEMAAFAARLTASSDAWFQLPELAMGLIPGAGGCVSVSARIGRQRAALMILSGRRISARTALNWGLVDAIVDDAPVDHGEQDVD
jgi:enoyl-CoA hydratase/carnithine racemase